MQSEANETVFKNWAEFIRREVEKILDKHLEGKAYDSLKSKEQIQSICGDIIQKLNTTNKNFKYIVNCVLMTSRGQGMDIGGMCYWDGDMDGSLAVKWERKFLTCIVNVYGVAH